MTEALANEPHQGKTCLRVLTRSNKNWAVQTKKMARALKFWIEIVEGLYYLCSENKDADQLHSYRAADLRLCFHICKKSGFLITQLK